MNKIKYFLILLLLSSCEGFSLLESDQKTVLYSKNIAPSPIFNGNLNIATFNMKLGFCKDCNPFSGKIGGDHQQLDRIVDMINQMNLKIITLQEVGYEYDTSIIEDQISYIAERTQMNYAFGMGRAFQTGDNLFLRGFIGNAILSKYEITSVENPTIRYVDYYNQNHVLKATIELEEGKEIVIFSPHLESGSTDNEKTLQINEILQQSNGITKPIIIAGDFNISYNTNNQFLSLLNQRFYNSLEKISLLERQTILNRGTFISGSIIDYIFIDKNNFSVLSGKLAPQEYRDISDHYPYILELAIK